MHKEKSVRIIVILSIIDIQNLRCTLKLRVAVIAGALANAHGIDIDKLPLAGAVPEWHSEKAVAIAFYMMASGIYAVLRTS